MDDKEKKLGLMRYWLFGSMLIIFVAMTIYIGGPLGTGLAILSETGYWLTVIIAVVLSVVWYNIYKSYLNK